MLFFLEEGNVGVRLSTQTRRELLQQIVLELDLLRPIRADDPIPGFDVTSSPARLRLHHWSGQ